MSGRRSPVAPVAQAPSRPRVRRGNADDAEQLRRDLTRAAVELVAEKGVAALSIRAVAARVGVSPMATYRYFADKADLLGGIWELVLTSLLAEYRTMLARTEGVRERQRGMEIGRAHV